MTPLAQLSVGRLADGRPLLSVSGEIDLSNVEQFERELLDAIGESATAVIDLTATDYLDSQGARVLHQLADRHVQGHLALEIVTAVDSMVHDVLTITSLHEVVPVTVRQPRPGLACSDGLP